MVKPTFQRVVARRWLQLALALGIGLVSLYLAVRGVDFQAVGQALRQADWGWAGAALAIAALNNCLKVIRWRALLGRQPVDGRGWLRLAQAFLVAQLLNAWFPVRLGEVGRVYALGDFGGYAFTAGTLMLEKVADMAGYSVLILLMLLSLPLPDWLGRPAVSFALLTVAVIAALALVIFKRSTAQRWFERLAQRLPGRLRALAPQHLAEGLSSLDVLQQPAGLGGLAVLTGLIWFTALATNQLALWALGLWLPWTAALLVLLALIISISLPSLPGNLGNFEYSCILALSVFGIERSQALSYGILLHVVVYLPVLLGGLASLAPLSVGLSRDST